MNKDNIKIGKYTYDDLVNEDRDILHLNFKLNELELDNLKYLNEDVRIYLRQRYYENIPLIMSTLKKYGMNNKVILSIKNKQSINNIIESNFIHYDNLYLLSNDSIINVKDYIRLENKLSNLCKPALNLSPFEKYIYVYDIVKKYKQYKENEINRLEARNLYQMLESDYIVCGGFINLFKELLDRLDIKSIYKHIEVDTSYDKIKNNDDLEFEVIPTTIEKHARLFVYLKDEKYSINGYYYSDPTWDNNLDKNYYSYLTMTCNESLSQKRYLWFNENDILELFDVQDMNEFDKKVQMLLRADNKYDDLEMLIKSLIDKIVIFDSSFLKDEKNKLKNAFHDKYTYENLVYLLYDIGNYILKHNNNEISWDTLQRALTAIYKDVYSYTDEEIKKEMNKISLQNLKRYPRSFPTRYKEYNDHKEIYSIINNKFDMENSSKKI